ncbi:SEL1-like repeat protein [Acinetobacter bereziniae]|uniref:SEL1-like repeat protein n=1 Tax=Acinetobacter bereziniae TaxID=106648 RepID=UPI001115B383|nr:SEL1-like repeat protein [Acinetobacter bereziniae]MBO3655910.1 sel1 repeat family protein [Acinetobacter bereziniae]TNL50825.1 sel1 repeat family protein [Acinetobacter bereziniae]TNL54271.1 sel1 repeat family protein [Acinetobacter bereziniae]
MSGHTNNTENIALNGAQHSQAEAWYIEVLKLEQQGFAQTEQDAQARVDLLVNASNQDFAPASTLLGQWHVLGRYLNQSIPSAILFFQHAAKLNHGLAHLELAYLGLNHASDQLTQAQALMHLQQAVQLNHPEAIFVYAQQQLAQDPQTAYQLLLDNYLKNQHQNSLKFCVEFSGFDPIKVQNELLKIAEKDHFACALLAFSYFMQHNLDAAFKYAEISQQHNDPFGCYVRALVEQQCDQGDATLAQEFLLKAAKNGHIESAYLAAVNLLKNAENAKTEQKHQEYATLAVELLSHAAVAGHVPAQYSLAQCLRYGLGTEKNLDQGVSWLERAAMQNHPDAQFELSMLLPLEHEHHLPLLNAAAEKGHTQAMLCMSIFEQRQDNAQGALDWLNKAKELQVPRAFFLLGQMYREGKCVDVDLSLSADLFKQAADHGDIDSYFELFKIYKDGIGVRKNKKTASKYLDLAKENQHIEAASIEF